MRKQYIFIIKNAMASIFKSSCFYLADGVNLQKDKNSLTVLLQQVSEKRHDFYVIQNNTDSGH